MVSGFLGNILRRIQSLGGIGTSPNEHNIQWGDMRRLTPVSPIFGFDRGKPIDRYYIENFLRNNSGDIRGRVLEIGSPHYTRMFDQGQVTGSDVLHAVEGNDEATLVGDLSTGKNIPQNSFDCMILTQTLLCIYDVRSAIRNIYSALKPGGTVLATVPGISQISRYDMDRWGDYWRFTTLSIKRLFSEHFPLEQVTIRAYGNVFVAIAFLQGLATEDLTEEEFDYHDPDYEVVITIRATKPSHTV